MFQIFFLGIYVGGVELKYYSFPLTIFTVLGFCYLGKSLQKLFLRQQQFTEKGMIFGVVPAVLAAVMIMQLGSINAEAREVKKEDHYLYRLQQAMEVTGDTTLLNIS